MSFYDPTTPQPEGFRQVLASFLVNDGLPFSEVLSVETIEQVCREEGIETVPPQDDNAADEQSLIYTLPVTLWAFLSQVLCKETQRSCLAAVSRVATTLVALGRRGCSTITGAYCRARARLPEILLKRLTFQVARGCEEKVPPQWQWHQRCVHLVDGTTASMPDTEANQEEYPQHGAQKKGLGFPIARLTAVISLSTAMVRGLAIGRYMGKETGETALLRPLITECFQPGDIVLADRYYCSYFMIALFAEQKVDCVFRLHQQRNCDFRCGQRLGQGDHLVEWTRPQRPGWMDEETYARMPATLRLREVEVKVSQPGYRTRSLVVTTTLLDARTYSKDELAKLYHKRWLVELDIRTIKCNMGMDVLTCKSPEMVRREIWTCLLAYNLIRQTMLEAALRAEVSPRTISFTAALNAIAASFTTWTLINSATAVRLITAHLTNLALHRVGKRPGRVEPRAIKRRPKPHRLLQQPREAARQAILAGAVDAQS